MFPMVSIKYFIIYALGDIDNSLQRTERPCPEILSEKSQILDRVFGFKDIYGFLFDCSLRKMMTR